MTQRSSPPGFLPCQLHVEDRRVMSASTKRVGANHVWSGSMAISGLRISTRLTFFWPILVSLGVGRHVPKHHDDVKRNCRVLSDVSGI